MWHIWSNLPPAEPQSTLYIIFLDCYRRLDISRVYLSMDWLCPAAAETCVYVKRHGICSVTHSGRSRLTAYFLMITCFIFQGLKTPGKCRVCGSMETTYSKLNAYTANTILQMISLQMIGSIRCLLFIYPFVLVSSEWTCFLGPSEHATCIQKKTEMGCTYRFW